MKQILCLLALVNFFCCANAQHYEQREIIHTIANLENGAPVVTEFSSEQLKIEKKIKWLLKLNDVEINLENQRIFYEQGKGWILQYEFQTTTQAGIYKEYLKKIDNKLMITEAREAKTAIATNCSKIVFTENDTNCSCAVKRSQNLESEVSFRLFSSLN